MFSYKEEVYTLSYPYIDWIIDSAASYHALPIKEIFTTNKAGDFGQVKMGNNSFASITGIGDVWIKTYIGYILLLKDKRHVLDLHLNLLYLCFRFGWFP